MKLWHILPGGARGGLKVFSQAVAVPLPFGQVCEMCRERYQALADFGKKSSRSSTAWST